MERYNLEDAQEEAAKLRKLVETGKAKSYKEADKIISEKEKSQKEYDGYYFDEDTFPEHVGGLEIRTKEESYFRQFNMFSPALSGKHESALAAIKEEIEQYPWIRDPNLRILAMPSSRDISAKADPNFGLMGASKDIFETKYGDIQRTVMLHERTHMHVGSEFRQYLIRNFPEIDNFFHKRIIPDWLSGKLESLEHDRQYMDKKEWRNLFSPYWSGMYEEYKPEDYQNAVGTYFTALQKGVIKIENGKIDLVASPDYPFPLESWDEVLDQPDISLEKLYEENPQQLARQILTGYEIMDKMKRNYQRSLDLIHGVSVWELEEGFANFVSCGLTRVNIDDVNRLYFQDRGKIRLAKRTDELAQKIGITAEQAIREVGSYEEMIEFYKKIGILKK